MAETRMLTDHDEIREWTAARMGAPVMHPAVPSVGKEEPVLEIAFGQHAYQEQDEGYDRPPTGGNLQIVEWSEWFEEFDRRGLGLVVAEEELGRVDSFHEIVTRGED